MKYELVSCPDAFLRVLSAGPTDKSEIIKFLSLIFGSSEVDESFKYLMNSKKISSFGMNLEKL